MSNYRRPHQLKENCSLNLLYTRPTSLVTYSNLFPQLIVRLDISMLKMISRNAAIQNKQG